MFDHDDYCYIFAMQTTEAWLRARGRVCRTYFWESVYSTLVLDHTELRNFFISVKNAAMVDAKRMCIYCYSGIRCCYSVVSAYSA